MDIVTVLIIIWCLTYFASRLVSYAEDTKELEIEARKKQAQKQRINALYGRDE